MIKVGVIISILVPVLAGSFLRAAETGAAAGSKTDEVKVATEAEPLYINATDPVRFNLQGTDGDGAVIVNGTLSMTRKFGSGKGPVRDLGPFFRPGENFLSVILHNGDGGSNIKFTIDIEGDGTPTIVENRKTGSHTGFVYLRSWRVIKR